MTTPNASHEPAGEYFAARVDELLADALTIQDRARGWLSDGFHLLDRDDPTYEQSLDAAEAIDATVYTLREASRHYHLFNDPTLNDDNATADHDWNVDLVGETDDGERGPKKVRIDPSSAGQEESLDQGAEGILNDLIELSENLSADANETAEWLYFHAPRENTNDDPARHNDAADATALTSMAVRACEIGASRFDQLIPQLEDRDTDRTPNLAVVPDRSPEQVATAETAPTADDLSGAPPTADATALLADIHEVHDHARVWLADAHRSFDHDDALYAQALTAASTLDDAVATIADTASSSAGAPETDTKSPETASTALTIGNADGRLKLVTTDEHGALTPFSQNRDEFSSQADRDLRRDGLCEESVLFSTHLAGFAQHAETDAPGSELSNALRTASDRFGDIYTTRTTGQQPNHDSTTVQRSSGDRTTDPFVELNPVPDSAYGYEPPARRDAEGVLNDVVDQLGHDHQADNGSHWETSPRSEPELRYRSAVVAEAVVPGLIGTDQLREFANQYREHEDAYRKDEILTGRADDPIAVERGLAVSDATAFVYGDDYYTLPPTMVGDLISEDAREAAYRGALASGGMSRAEVDRLHAAYDHADPEAYEAAQFRDEHAADADPSDRAGGEAISADCHHAVTRAEQGLHQLDLPDADVEHDEDVARWHAQDQADRAERSHDTGPVIETDSRDPY